MRIITQRELRNDNASIMREVEAGESFTVTKYGAPVARIEPVAAPELPVATPASVRGGFGELTRVTVDVATSEVLDDLRGER